MSSKSDPNSGSSREGATTTTPRLDDLDRFHQLLLGKNKPRIVAVCGAGLSASSGLPTFRGAGGLWRNHKSTDLATPESFERNPGLVWLFYAYRRHMSLKAEPNDGHRALAALADKYESFLCVSQNVDNLLERAGHRQDKLYKIHGSLFGLKCENESCDWRAADHTSDPLWPVLAPASASDVDPTKTLPLLDPSTPAPEISRADIPTCPRCEDGASLQRPDIVWFGEGMSYEVTRGVRSWMRDGVDIVLSIGTSEAVSTAEGFLRAARRAGAVYVNVNLDARSPEGLSKLGKGDFAFEGDAAEILPKLFAPLLED
ncbi:related to NAD-dependent histone deacetylase [Cephalotrichum gorgonifer]|uniref:Related to NAD-dependent histone deacetylase n=1 Tax=Cephalotrichum gorgonifer TaxID=2041049 RepID=A0AAE8MY57_9PEZI|nr:related to NAD-dependent histone deacetylase [Cephalotrichum gorgonifer]